MDNNVEKTIERACNLFDERISKKDFQNKLDCLDTDKIREMDKKLKWRFIRSCEAFRYAKICETISFNISTLLLCISIEALSDPKSSLIFKDWIIKYKLKDLGNLQKGKLRNKINQLYEDYIQNENSRGGAIFNFKNFLLTYCPSNLRKVKIISEIGGRQFEFDEVLTFIYEKYRSRFAHEALKRIMEFENCTHPLLLNAPILDVYKNKEIEDNFDYNWFKSVVLESLFNYLNQEQPR